jgi:hypothetical protein
MVKFRRKLANAEQLIVRNKGSLVKFRERTANMVELNIRNNENKKWYNVSCLLAYLDIFIPYHQINVKAIDPYMEM